MKTALAALLVLAVFLTATAETARWPLRIVETSYTVHRLTGITSNERSKEKTSVVAVDINKTTKDGASFITLKRRFTKSMLETESETGQCALPWERREDLIAAISKAKQEMSRISSDSSDSEELLFDDPAMKLRLMRINRRQKLIVEIGDNTTFDLAPSHTSQFFDIIRRIK